MVSNGILSKNSNSIFAFTPYFHILFLFVAPRQSSLEKCACGQKKCAKKIPLNFAFKEISQPVLMNRFVKRTGPRQTQLCLLSPNLNRQLRDCTQEIIWTYQGLYAPTHVRGIAINTHFSMLRTSVQI